VSELSALLAFFASSVLPDHFRAPATVVDECMCQSCASLGLVLSCAGPCLYRLVPIHLSLSKLSFSVTLPSHETASRAACASQVAEGLVCLLAHLGVHLRRVSCARQARGAFRAHFRRAARLVRLPDLPRPGPGPQQPRRARSSNTLTIFLSALRETAAEKARGCSRRSGASKGGSAELAWT
jgi:hypothetical protein